MSSWLYKKASHDARYGVVNFREGGRQNYRKPGNQARSGGFGLSTLIAPTTIAMALAMLYGGHRIATTHDEYSEVVHHSFSLVFINITHFWSGIIAFLGVTDNRFATLVIEFAAVIVALAFAVFAGIGGAAVCLWQICFGA